MISTSTILVEPTKICELPAGEKVTIINDSPCENDMFFSTDNDMASLLRLKHDRQVTIENTEEYSVAIYATTNGRVAQMDIHVIRYLEMTFHDP